jgi:hypothetical protein
VASRMRVVRSKLDAFRFRCLRLEWCESRRQQAQHREPIQSLRSGSSHAITPIAT